MQWTIECHRQIEWSSLEERQDELVQKIRPGEAFLLFSEPQPTFTCGRSGLPHDLFWQEDELKKRGIQTAKVSRGGKWTFHGPGQVLLYPIVRLEDLGLSSKGSRVFVDTFRDCFLSFLNRAGVPAGVPTSGQNLPYGIYVKEKKVASFGLDFRGGVSTHGCALYLKKQGAFFSGINPCGSRETPISSLEELGYFLSWEDSVSQLISHVKKSFNLKEKPLLYGP
jgi:lipoyl(octanoyl) transferase